MAPEMTVDIDDPVIDDENESEDDKLSYLNDNSLVLRIGDTGDKSLLKSTAG